MDHSEGSGLAGATSIRVPAEARVNRWPSCRGVEWDGVKCLMRFSLPKELRSKLHRLEVAALVVVEVEDVPPPKHSHVLRR